MTSNTVGPNGSQSGYVHLVCQWDSAWPSRQRIVHGHCAVTCVGCHRGFPSVLEENFHAVCGLLCIPGASPSAADRQGNASLHIATQFGHLQLVKMLIKYDADVYQRGAKGAIPSHIAAREGHIHLIQV